MSSSSSLKNASKKSIKQKLQMKIKRGEEIVAREVLSQDGVRKVLRVFDVSPGAPCLAGTSARMRSLSPMIMAIRQMKRTYEDRRRRVAKCCAALTD